MIRRLLLLLYLCTIAFHSHSQYSIFEVGKVMYANSGDSVESEFLRKVAVQCNQFIQEYYPKQDTLMVRLNVLWTSDTSFYQLGYDNLEGNLIERAGAGPYTCKISNSIIAKASGYPGIRISIASKTVRETDVLKLLEYGILHFEELKRPMLNALKSDYFNRPSRVEGLSSQTIDSIVQAPPSGRVVSLLDTANLDPNTIAVAKTFDEAVQEMLSRMDNAEKTRLKSMDEGTAVQQFRYADHDPFFYVNWHLQNRDESPLVAFFTSKKVTDVYDAYEILLRGCYRRLNNYSMYLDDVIATIARRRERHEQELSVRMSADTLNGVYIPKDLSDCFVQLDGLLSKEDREKIMGFPNKEEAARRCHPAIGNWMQSNWGLAEGSRLQRFFIDRHIDYPESMSSLILEFYYDWLKGEVNYIQTWVNRK